MLTATATTATVSLSQIVNRDARLRPDAELRRRPKLLPAPRRPFLRQFLYRVSHPFLSLMSKATSSQDQDVAGSGGIPTSNSHRYWENVELTSATPSFLYKGCMRNLTSCIPCNFHILTSLIPYPSPKISLLRT